LGEPGRLPAAFDVHLDLLVAVHAPVLAGAGHLGAVGRPGIGGAGRGVHASIVAHAFE
jgi:hypothetical protein